MAISFQGFAETDFTNPENWWVVNFPTGRPAPAPGDYVLILLASPNVGVLWQPASGWTPLDGFSTVQFTLGGTSQTPLAIPVSYALFGKFYAPDDGLSVTFPIEGAPTAVVGSLPGQAAGVALCAVYRGVSPAGALRGNPPLSFLPPLQLSYGANANAVLGGAGTQVTETIGPFNPVTTAPVPPVYAEQTDWLLAPIIIPGAPTGLTVPAGFTLRATTTGGSGIVIALADFIVSANGLQSGLQWTGTAIPTPVLNEAVVLWPDAGNLDQELVFFATTTKSPAHFAYRGSQEPTVVSNSIGYRLKFYAGPQENPPAVFAPNLLQSISLLVTRSDGSTFQQALTASPDGTYAWCTSGNNWFPYEGRYYLQLQLTWLNGAIEFSSQMYLYVSTSAGVNPQLSNLVIINTTPYTINESTPSGTFFMFQVAGGGTIYLPPALGSGYRMAIKNGSSGALTLMPSLTSPSDTIDGNASYSLLPLGSNAPGQNSINLEDTAIGTWSIW